MFDWFWEFLYGIVKSILYCIDFILDFALMLAGIEPVVVEGQQTELTYFFLTSDHILDAFKLVTMIGFVLLFIFTAFSVLRSIGRFGAEKTAVRVCLDGAKTIIYFLLVPAIMILSSVFVSAIMTSIYRATSYGSASLGASMFTLFADEAYNGDASQKEYILNCFRSNAGGNYDYYKTGVVNDYFKLKDINYFLAYLTGVAVLVLLVKPLLTFVERIVSLVILFIVAPLSASTAVLDDGARFKLWRDETINRFLTAYGSLIALNVFILLIGVIYDVQFFKDSYLNGLARLLFVLGGAFATRTAPTMIGNLINHGAGSQLAADQAHSFGGLARMGGMAFGATRGLLNRANRAAFHNPASRLAGNHVKGRIDDKLHRASNVRKSLKAEAERTRQLGDISQKFDAKINRGIASGRFKSAADVTRATEGSWKGRLSSPQSNPTLNTVRDIGSILLGQGGGGGKDNSQNQASQSTLKDAMSRSRTTDGGKK